MFKNFFVGAFITTFFAFTINSSVRASDFVDEDVSDDERVLGDYESSEYNEIIQLTFDKLSQAKEELKKQIALFKPWKALYDEKNQPKDHEKVFNLETGDQLEHHLSIARSRIQKEYRDFRDCSDNYLNREFVSKQADLVSMKDECDFLHAFIYEGIAINRDGKVFLNSVIANYADPSWVK